MEGELVCFGIVDGRACRFVDCPLSCAALNGSRVLELHLLEVARSADVFDFFRSARELRPPLATSHLALSTHNPNYPLGSGAYREGL